MLPFLDTKTIVEEDGNLRFEVYRKPTHTDQYLAFDSHHPLEHKLAVIKTLFHRADNIVTSDQAKTDEQRHLRGVLAKCGYQNWTFNKALKPSDQSKKTQKCKPLTNKNKANITIPYVQGVSEKLRRIFQNFNIATNFKPHSTLRQRLVHPKDRSHKGTKANVIYRLKCEEPNCNNTYIGETSRPLKVRYKEHCRPSANGYSSAIFHHLQHNQGHSFKLESTDVLDRETRWWERGVKPATCLLGEFGPGCTGICHCASGDFVCDIRTGVCSSGGCEAGLKGGNCQKACSPGEFGTDCTGTCHCASGDSVCDIRTGVCSSGGCEAGWMGNNCQTECSGTYGPDCSITCGHCYGSQTCDRFTGRCPTGGDHVCVAGYNGDKCDQECYDSYGPDCVTPCGHCYLGACDRFDGTCPTGWFHVCEAGYSGTKCDQECSGTYGPDCSTTCGHCYRSQTCNRFDGTCPTGGSHVCAAGYDGDNCDQECYDGYGPDCGTPCGHCAWGLACDRFDGTCPEGAIVCEDGYGGTKCDHECSGAYGPDCYTPCGHCYWGTCDRFDGRCTKRYRWAPLCKAGYDGYNCDQECSGTYGPDCDTTCGHCYGGQTCERFTGTCPTGGDHVCEAGYYGDKCDQSQTLTQTARFCGHKLNRPPSDQGNSLDELDRSIGKMGAKINSDNVIILGDFNTPGIKWETTVADNSQAYTGQAEKLLNLMDTHGLFQTVQEPTRNGNLLDLVLVNNPNINEKTTVVPGISDHDMVLVDVNLALKQNRKPKRKVYIRTKADEPAIKKDLMDYATNFHKRTQDMSVTQKWSDTEDKMKDTMNKHIPSKITSSRYNLPWFNRNLRRHCRKKQRLHNKAKKTGQEEDWNKYKRVKKGVQKSIRQAHSKYVADILGEAIVDKPKTFWSYIKGLRKDLVGVAPLKVGNTIISDSGKKAEVLSSQFKSVFTEEDTTDMPSLGQPCTPPMEHIVFSTDGVEKMLQGLNPSKASGPDQIPPWFLKLTASEIAPVLTNIFQHSLNTAEIPKDWRDANICPIFKKGDRAVPSNYRPVSLTCISCKLLEHIIHSQIMKHLESYSILTDYQHGFRAKRSTETQLILTVHDIAGALNSKRQVDLAILDFTKAFDKVPHGRLISKLEYYGIQGPTLNWLKAFLTNREQTVVVEGKASAPVKVASGVPQGTVLGPLLFLLYINDLPDQLDSNVRLFADDCLLYVELSTQTDSQLLQKDLNTLEEWQSKWLMQFNPEKCYIMHITNKRTPHATSYQFCGQALATTKIHPYLGVTLTSGLKEQTAVVEGKASAPVRVASGVPQGTFLGPLLFLLFINDLPDQLDSKGQWTRRSAGRPWSLGCPKSKLDSSVLDNSPDISLDGNSIERKDRADESQWGSCLMYYRNGIALQRRLSLEPTQFEIMIATVKLSSGTLLLSLLYRPPSDGSEAINWYIDNLDDLQSQTNATTTLLAGDYNVQHKEWPQSKDTDSQGQQALTLSITHGLTQLVDGPTHQNGNRLDLIMFDLPTLCSAVQISPEVGTADHYLLEMSVQLSPVQEPVAPRRIWIYSKADWDSLRGSLRELTGIAYL
ncbi:hypothetical protein Bbelb_160420 [Branchiostoma belcheri]|nr:hypothetical protein Bbelb_160420 [Branchiostoma belcheri]